MLFIKAGYSFTVGQDFARAPRDIPVQTLAPTEYAKPGHVIAYIDGDPSGSSN